MDVVTALQQLDEGLSAGDRRIAAVVTGDFDFAVNASIVELAERAGVSPPTVTRFCRRLGCRSFSDFKVRLAQTAFVGKRYAEPQINPVSTADIAGSVVSGAVKALTEMAASLDSGALEWAGAVLSTAQMIHAFGSGGNSAVIASELQNRLFRLGLRISATADHGMQLMLAAAAAPGDVIIGSSFTGRNRELERALSLARERRITTVVLTRKESPLAALADIALTIDLPEGEDIFRPTATRFAYLAVVDMLAMMVAHARADEAGPVLRRIKQQLVLRRDGDDSQPLGD